MKSIFKNESFLALLLFLALIFIIYFQVTFFGKSLLATLYYPEPLSTVNRTREPINSFNIDLAMPSFYEIPVNKFAADIYKRHSPSLEPLSGMWYSICRSMLNESIFSLSNLRRYFSLLSMGLLYAR